MAEEDDRKEPGVANAKTSDTTRITVDLSPADYRQLRKWIDAAADELEVARVPIADGIRAMIRVTALDKGVSAEVIDAIRRAREED